MFFLKLGVFFSGALCLFDIAIVFSAVVLGKCFLLELICFFEVGCVLFVWGVVFLILLLFFVRLFWESVSVCVCVILESSWFLKLNVFCLSGALCFLIFVLFVCGCSGKASVFFWNG